MIKKTLNLFQRMKIYFAEITLKNLSRLKFTSCDLEMKFCQIDWFRGFSLVLLDTFKKKFYKFAANMTPYGSI
ncbi:hypothetical protein BpHYR1_000083 [Brachionus plicatilis]|uniref:Uncharacterized protein n=1 Tax=Brachionus plicatilis TaxID=10195 RepID=A0A3M7SNJ3_BRAPC|nr:hypothetical protein BpHYR1_000083 [Brachionus plicatilis]